MVKMNRWDNLSLQEKNQLLGIYASKGYTDLASIISHYNTFQAGGRMTFQQWKDRMRQKYPDIEMDNNKAGYDYETYFNDNYNEAVAQLNNLRHFPDTYKLYNHPTFSNESVYSRGPMIGGSWGYAHPWDTQWSNTEGFTPSIVNRQIHPEIYKEDRPYNEEEIYSHIFDIGGPKNKGAINIGKGAAIAAMINRVPLGMGITEETSSTNVNRTPVKEVRLEPTGWLERNLAEQQRQPNIKQSSIGINTRPVPKNQEEAESYERARQWRVKQQRRLEEDAKVAQRADKVAEKVTEKIMPIIQLVDPTGITSYPDAALAWLEGDTGNAIWETIAALPFLNKLKTKNLYKPSKITKTVDKITRKVEQMIPTDNVLPIVWNSPSFVNNFANNTIKNHRDLYNSIIPYINGANILEDFRDVNNAYFSMPNIPRTKNYEPYAANINNPLVLGRSVSPESLNSILKFNYTEGSPSLGMMQYNAPTLKRLEEMYTNDEGITFLFDKDILNQPHLSFLGDADTPIKQKAAQALGKKLSEVSNITPQEVVEGKRILMQDFPHKPISDSKLISNTRNEKYLRDDEFYNEVLLDDILDYRKAKGAVINTDNSDFENMLIKLGIPYDNTFSSLMNKISFKGFSKGGKLNGRQTR